MTSKRARDALVVRTPGSSPGAPVFWAAGECPGGPALFREGLALQSTVVAMSIARAEEPMETPHTTPDPDPIPSPSEGEPTVTDPVAPGRRPMSARTMFVAALLGVVAALALVAAITSGGSGDGEDATELAGLEFLTVEGSMGSLADFEGQPLVVNFFASWCPPCRAELPDLEKVHLAHRDTVTFLGVNHDLDETTWRSFVDESEITYATVFQPDTELFTALGAQGMPSTAFVSPDGEVLHLHTGLLTDDALEDLIAEHLEGA